MILTWKCSATVVTGTNMISAVLKLYGYNLGCAVLLVTDCCADCSIIAPLANHALCHFYANHLFIHMWVQDWWWVTVYSVSVSDAWCTVNHVLALLCWYMKTTCQPVLVAFNQDYFILCDYTRWLLATNLNEFSKHTVSSAGCIMYVCPGWFLLK